MHFVPNVFRQLHQSSHYDHDCASHQSHPEENLSFAQLSVIAEDLSLLQFVHI